MANATTMGIRLDASCRVKPDSRQQYARWVRFRPGNEQVVTLNPPRFSWPYAPEIAFREKSLPAGRRFSLQISKAVDFASVDVEVRDTPYNFYNFLAPLEGAQTYFWRVGYDVGTDREQWSDAQSFSLSDDAVVWDRSGSVKAMDQVKGHPRILFTPDTRNAVLGMAERDALSAKIRKHIIDQADKTVESDWYDNFPKTDDDLLTNYMQMGRSLVFVMFAHLLTADAVYEGYKSRFLTIASWPIGGYASPEGAGSVQKWPSHLTEYLGLFYDWCYDVLSENERAVVKGSLEWRINYTMHSFAWETDDGTTMRPGSISVRCKSHAFENLMVTIPGALAICDESEVAREALEIGLHYVMGMTSGMGEDEGWNEGPGYGNGKMKWLMDATWYLQTAMPDLDFGVNDMYDAYCDFFARITPIGAKHISFGNRGFNESDWASSRITTFRRVAMLCQNGQAIQNWGDTRRRLQDLGMAEPMPFSPWIDYALPFYAGTPEPELDAKNARLFSIEGWVMASSASPSDYEAQKNAVSMTFACRPRGGYSHAFRSENAFDIHAYGETLAVGGGTTSNQSHFANHTMSHNTVLINGREQEAAKDEFVPFCGRIVAFEQGDGFVYWAGDATAAYGEATGMGRFVRHVVFVEGSYFVIFDDLAVVEGHDPTTFQWLYHVTPEVPLNFDADKFSVRYAVGQTHVVMQHVGDVADLTFQNLKGADGMVNPITGENLCQLDKWLTGKEWKRQIKKIPTPIEAHHLWISHGTPQREMQFLTVIAPFRNGETAPEIEGLSDRAVRVTFRERERVIAFDGRDDADISVDCSGIINNATEAISER